MVYQQLDLIQKKYLMCIYNIYEYLILKGFRSQAVVSLDF